jgi:cytochrome b involved in lipid metabolism
MKKYIAALSCLLLASIGIFVFSSSKTSSSIGSVKMTTDPVQNMSSNISNSNQKTAETKKIYTTKDVEAHSTKNDCWTIINNDVYDITSYVPMHPGGINQITRICGKDGTSLFASVPQHNNQSTNQLAKLKIGSLN